MPSRRKRKRERQKVEATASSPGTCGGWGGGVPTKLADLVLLRQAINEDWPVSSRVRQAIIDEFTAEIDTPDVRRSLSVARSFLTMESANIRAETIG